MSSWDNLPREYDTSHQMSPKEARAFGTFAMCMALGLEVNTTQGFVAKMEKGKLHLVCCRIVGGHEYLSLTGCPYSLWDIYQQTTQEERDRLAADFVLNEINRKDR